MARISPQDDVINGITPLEDGLIDVHPRLFFNPENIAVLRERIKRKPWSGFFNKIRQQASIGVEPLHGVVYLLTGEQEALAKATAALEKLIAPERPTRFYHLCDTAFLYDWLYNDLDEGLRTRARDFLDRHGREAYETMATRQSYHSGLYTCNIFAEQLAEITAAGCALYGDVPNVGTWLRSVMEKAKVMTMALGSDGASQEGICYGGFYVESSLRVLCLVNDLLGWDLQSHVPFFENTPAFFLYSALPRKQIAPPLSPQVPSRHVHLFFGDGVRYPWYGPGFFLRRLASIYRNPQSQWLADILDKADANANGVGNFLNLVWHDTSIKPKSPASLPTLRHFTDKDIVIMRSGWDGKESVFGFKCGPHAGHYALQNYRQNIGGGHMSVDAGSFLLFAHGDWLICEGGYTKKATFSRNTVLINGIGQTGDTQGKSEWFECTELRREKRGPSIVHVESHPTFDYTIGNVAPAYEHTAGLKRFLRHVLFVKPDVWIIADELEAKMPSKFELFFHASADEHATNDRPFAPAGERQWISGGANGKVRITALSPGDVTGHPEVQAIPGIGGAHIDRQMSVLRLANGTPTKSAVFITVLEAFPVRRGPKVDAIVEKHGRRYVVTLQNGKKRLRIAFSPGQRYPGTPAFKFLG